MHFDLTDPDQLIGKNLLWFSNCVPLNEKEVGNIRLIGSVFFGNYVLANQLLQTTNIFSSVATICQSKLQQITIKTDDVRKLEVTLLSENIREELKISTLIDWWKKFKQEIFCAAHDW